MISLLSLYKEFGGTNVPSIKESFNPDKYPGQKEISAYLANGMIKLASPGVGIDVVTGKAVSLRHEIMTDGEYTWDSMCSYYVNNYNLKLPEDFENKVFSCSNSEHK